MLIDLQDKSIHRPFEMFTFPGGEPHFKLDEFVLDDIFNKHVTIRHSIRSFNDFGYLLMAIDAVKSCNPKQVIVEMSYFPGARQDRRNITGEAFGAKVYCDILKNSGVDFIFSDDLHSDVVPSLLDGILFNSDNAETIKLLVKRVLPEKYHLVSPDAGSLKKLYKIASKIGIESVVECSKLRDIKTGNISKFSVNSEDLKGIDCLVVDDICDGGGTFIGLAKELKKKNCGKLYLFVSHGIFSKGLEELNKYYECIYFHNKHGKFEESQKLKRI